MAEFGIKMRLLLYSKCHKLKYNFYSFHPDHFIIGPVKDLTHGSLAVLTLDV